MSKSGASGMGGTGHTVPRAVNRRANVVSGGQNGKRNSGTTETGNRVRNNHQNKPLVTSRPLTKAPRTFP